MFGFFLVHRNGMSAHLVFSIFLSLVMDSSRFAVSALECCAYRITESVSEDSFTSSLSRSVPTRHYSVSPLTVPPVSSLLCPSLIASWLTDLSFCKAHLLSALSQDICTWYTFFLAFFTQIFHGCPFHHFHPSHLKSKTITSKWPSPVILGSPPSP